MTRQLVEQLASSTIMKDDIKVLRQKNVTDWKYDQIAQTIHQRLEDIQFEKRTDKQTQDHEARLAKGAKGNKPKGEKGGGGGGGGGKGGGGGTSYASMTDKQKVAHDKAAMLKNQTWQRSLTPAKGWSQPPQQQANACSKADWSEGDWQAQGKKARSRTPKGAWSDRTWQAKPATTTKKKGAIYYQCMPNAELTDHMCAMKEKFKDICWPYQTHMNSHTCPGALDGTCAKIHTYAKTTEEYSYVPTPDYILKAWKDNSTGLKALNVTPKTPHTALASKGKGKDDKPKDGKAKGDKGDAKGKDGKGKGNGKGKGKGKGKDDKGKGKDGKGKGKGKGKKGKDGKKDKANASWKTAYSLTPLQDDLKVAQGIVDDAADWDGEDWGDAADWAEEEHDEGAVWEEVKPECPLYAPAGPPLAATPKQVPKFKAAPTANFMVRSAPNPKALPFIPGNVDPWTSSTITAITDMETGTWSSCSEPSRTSGGFCSEAPSRSGY